LRGPQHPSGRGVTWPFFSWVPVMAVVVMLRATDQRASRVHAPTINLLQHCRRCQPPLSL